MKWAFLIFTGLYVIAVVLLAIGVFGWFGQEKDPLSAVFLMPLGLPWNLIADKLGFANWLTAVLAPAINATVLYMIWKR